MHGNVQEWVCSFYDKKYNGNERKCAAMDDNRNRVIRGGAWGLHAKDLRSASRRIYKRVNRGSRVGFRVVHD